MSALSFSSIPKHDTIYSLIVRKYLRKFCWAFHLLYLTLIFFLFFASSFNIKGRCNKQVQVSTQRGASWQFCSRRHTLLYYNIKLYTRSPIKESYINCCWRSLYFTDDDFCVIKDHHITYFAFRLCRCTTIPLNIMAYEYISYQRIITTLLLFCQNVIKRISNVIFITNDVLCPLRIN